MVADVFAYIGYIVLLINTILFFSRMHKKEWAYKLLAIYSLTMLIVQISSFVLRKLHMHNLFISHFYFILQFVILSFFYLEILKEDFQKKIVKIGLIICPIALLIQYLAKSNLFFKFNLFEIFITSIALIIYATFHLYNLLNETKKYYYVNIGVLLYLFGSTVVFLVGNLSLALHSELSFDAIWDLNIYLYVMYQLFIFYEWINIIYRIKPTTYKT